MQNWVRDMILDSYPTLHPDDVRSATMGDTGEDVKLSKAARGMFPYQVECKSLAKVAIYKYYDQAKEHGGHEPILFVKQNRRKPLVVMDAEHFFKRYHDGRK